MGHFSRASKEERALSAAEWAYMIALEVLTNAVIDWRDAHRYRSIQKTPRLDRPLLRSLRAFERAKARVEHLFWEVTEAPEAPPRRKR